MGLVVRPCELKDANAFVAGLHRHHKPVVGHRFSLSAWLELGGDMGVHGEKLVGVAIVGRPVARMVDPRTVLEVTRLCTDGTKNACSVLYAAAARAGRAMGYSRIQTYTLASEPGTSLLAAGWTRDGAVMGRSWSAPSRPRVDKHPTVDKVRWIKALREVLHAT